MGSQEDDPLTPAGGKGSSLEIFLFTNGHHESPPRKYNVRVNDRWDTTLNFLARSQNGLNHTIDLYTTEGKKIKRGQELTNGVAYVAVEPPQAFLPAGYNDYLMKASRSREKRQEKTSENESLINPDKNNSKDKMEEGSKDATNIKIIQDITIRSTSRTAVEEQDITNQVKSDIAKAVKPIRRMSIKQTQKRNGSLPLQNPHILRKNADNVTPPIKRGYNPFKLDASRKKVEISSIQNTKTSIAATKTDASITKTNENKSKGDEAGVIGVISRTHNSETVETYNFQKNTDMNSMPGTTITGYKATQNLTTDSRVIERNILLPVSPEKEPRESAYIIPIKMRSITNSSSNGKHTLFVPGQAAKTVPDIVNNSPLTVSPQADFPKQTNRTESKAAIFTNVLNETFQNNTLLFGSQTNDNNFAIYVRQGNMVNLKLNIEVKNVSSTTFDANSNKNKSSLSSENSPMKKFDGETLTHNIPGAKDYHEVPTLTEPGLTRLPCERLQQITTDLRVGVCNCCSCFRNPESLAPVYVDNNNYFILLPPEDVNEHLVSCTCNLEINQQSNYEIPNNKFNKSSRIENNIVKLNDSKISPTHTCNMTENFEIRKSSVIQDSTSMKTQLLLKNASITEKEVTQCECWMTSAQYETPACGCAQSLVLECACDYEQATCSDVVKQNAPANKKSSMFKDAFTQTDWSDIVLEARPREDGSYALHLPSLKLLKNTNYLY